MSGICREAATNFPGLGTRRVDLAGLFLAMFLTSSSCPGCAAWKPWAKAPAATPNQIVSSTNELSDAQTAELCLTLARQFETGGRLTEAASQYERALRYRPEAPGVHHRLAVVYDRLGQHEPAARSFQRAIEESPKDGRLWNDYGYYHYQRGRWHDAEIAFRKSCELAPNLERNSVNLGLALAQQGQAAEAYREFTRVLSPAAAHSNLGMVYAQQGRHAEAQTAFDQSLVNEPGLPQPQAAQRWMMQTLATRHGIPTGSGATSGVVPASFEVPVVNQR